MYDYNRDNLIKNSIDCFEPCPFNPEKIYLLVKEQRRKYVKAKNILKKVKKEHGTESPEYQEVMKAKGTAFGRYHNDFNALRTIFLQRPTIYTSGDKNKKTLKLDHIDFRKII